jgi:TM2 domain-containing membrane protein YozV
LFSMAEVVATRPRFCSQCGQPVVVAGAVFCKECGARLNASGVLGELKGNTTAAVAFVLSVVPGLGHFYAGRTGRAIMWFMAVLAIAYPISWSLGLLMHLVCGVSAARAAMLDAERHSMARASRKLKMSSARFGPAADARND